MYTSTSWKVKMFAFKETKTRKLLEAENQECNVFKVKQKSRPRNPGKEGTHQGMPAPLPPPPPILCGLSLTKQTKTVF